MSAWRARLQRACTGVEYAFAFGFGSGLMPIAPGTFGTLAAIPLYVLIMHWSPGAYGVCVLLAFLFGVRVCNTVSNALGVHDYPGIVWDEVVGYLLTMYAVPIGIGWMCAGFCLFRVFDILKPWPIGWVDARVPGGLGIMLDDVLAALPALLLLQLAAHGLA